MTEALHGIRVLDLTRTFPPAFSAMFLADFGAEVIKVDPVDSVSPYSFLGMDPEKWNAHCTMDRNKKSIQLNFRTEAGRQVFYKLIKKSDVLIENSRPGTMQRLGADYDVVKEMNPRLIYCSVSGYGQDGPYRDMPGHDMNYCAIAGALSLIGERNRTPVLASNLIGDQAGAGLYPTIGILVALLARERTGAGQFIDAAYTDGVVSLLTFEAALYFCTGRVPKRGETHTTGGVPGGAVYETKDGKYVSLGCMEPRFWSNLCQALGLEQFIPHQWDSEKREAIFSAFRKVFLGRTRDEWFQSAKDNDFCLTPVYDLDEAFSDPQIIHRQMLLELQHPKLGKVRQTGMPLKLSQTPAQFKTFPPNPGEHTNDVLQDLGYTRDEIEAMRKARDVG